MSKKLLFRLAVLVASMMCVLGASAQEAYAVYTTDNTTLSLYYDTQRSSRPGTTYDLNTGYNYPDWYTDGTNFNVTKVVFDPSFAGARPTSTIYWFFGLFNLQSITGLEYLNTSEVTDMAWMFFYCTNLTSLDLSHSNTSKVNSMYNMLGYCQSLTSLDLSSFNTSQVISMSSMFDHCANLRTIYVGDGWNTAAVTISQDMFKDCISLVGGQGTTYDANHIDATYAHIDGGTSNPGYFTAKNASLRGDVNGDGSVNISDVTALIDYLLSGNASGINLSGADCDQDGSINISDVTALIDYLLSGRWN
jgi:surface protein